MKATLKVLKHKQFWGLTALVLLSGCSAQLTFIDRADGKKYSGATGATSMRKSGDVTADIAGQAYAGEWIYVPNGGGFALATGTANATAFGSAGFASGFGSTSSTTALLPTQGNGLITLRNEANAIRCVYNFNEWGNTGVGACERTDGRVYDLMIKR